MDSPPAWWWKLTRTISRPLKNFIINIFILSLTHTAISTEIQQTTPSSFSQTTFTGSDFHFVWKHWSDAKNPFIVIRIYATVVPKQKQTRDLLAFWNGNTYSLSVHQHQIVQKSSRCFWWNWGIGLGSFWCISERPMQREGIWTICSIILDAMGRCFLKKGVWH